MPVVRYVRKVKPVAILVLKRHTTVLNLRVVLVIVSSENSGIQAVVNPSSFENTKDDARAFT